MHDPIADMLTRIRNAQHYKHETVSFPTSKLKVEVLKVLKEEGFINDFRVVESQPANLINVELKYFQGQPVIDRIKRISRPGLRVYKNAKTLPHVSRFGVAILSTSQGVMTHLSAKEKGIGGEIICEVA